MNTNLNTSRFSFFKAAVAASIAAVSLVGCAMQSAEDEAAAYNDEIVGEAEEAVTTVPFPGNLTATLGASTISGYEPSGLAWYNNIVYMASDDGRIASYNATTNAWSPLLSYTDPRTLDDADFESLSVATMTAAAGAGTQLMVGIEGTGTTYAQIAKVNVAGQSMGSIWTLNNVTGMEAMTFVPDNYTPFGPANTAAHPSDFAGYFFVATQNKTGFVSVYRLGKNTTQATFVHEFTIDIASQTSDLCFANGVLYTLFDDNTNDLLAIYTINTNPNNKMLAFQKQYGLPAVYNSINNVAPAANYEAIMFDRQTIYLGRDSAADPLANGVFKFANTIMYPQTVLPPLFW